MPHSRIDRAFRRYQRTGSPRALARVFDEAAPELYRIAYHLVGDRHAAEDLVQTTFLTALQDHESFRAGGQVVPWLCGILTNRALHHRRQARSRGRAPATDGRLDTARKQDDPAAIAERDELRQSVARTIRGLAEPYRQVLLLHVVHDLTPKEVAEALDRPNATVRVQLHRGLDLLRRALPAGVTAAAGGAMTVPAPSGLGAIRARVLGNVAELNGAGASAAGTLALTGGNLTRGLLLMKNVIALGATIVAAVFALLWWPAGDSAPGEHRPAAAPAAPDPALAAASGPPHETAGASLKRTAATTRASSQPTSLTVAVQWWDGSPAHGVTVRCVPLRPAAEAETKADAGVTWGDIGRDNQLRMRSGRTDRHGAVRFVDVAATRVQVTGDRGGAIVARITSGEENHCALELPRGVDVRGRVVDVEDRPIGGATVRLSIAEHSDESEAVALSAADGTFMIRSARNEGILSATAPGYGSESLEVVAAERARAERVLRLRALPGILVGTVVDPGNRPVPNASVLVGVTALTLGTTAIHRRLAGKVQGLDHWPSRFVRTDGNGQFRVEGLPPLPWPVCVGATGYAATHTTVQVQATGETHATVRLGFGATVAGRVVDALGAPVAGARIHLRHLFEPAHVEIGLGMAETRAAPLWARSGSLLTDAKGRFVYERVMPGRVHLMADHERAVAETRIEVAAGQTYRWDAVIAAPSRLIGLVVDEAGKPLRGWQVETAPISNPEDFTMSPSFANGRFEIAATEPAYVVRVRPPYPSIAAPFVWGEARPRADPIPFVVPASAIPSAAIRGRVVLPDGQPVTSGTVVARPTEPWGWGHTKVAASGTFQTAPLGPGRFSLQLRTKALGYHDLGVRDIGAGEVVDLGTLMVPSPGRIELTAIDRHGAVRPDAWILCRRIDDMSTGGDIDMDEGRASGYLRPGHYVATCRQAIAAVAFEIRAGETTRAELVLPAKDTGLVLRPPADLAIPLEVRCRDAQGALVSIQFFGGEDAGKDRTLPATAGRYELEVRSSGHDSLQQSVSIETGQTTTLDLLAPSR